MIVQCTSCSAVMKTKGIKEGDVCLWCYEPMNSRECIMVEEPLRGGMRVG